MSPISLISTDISTKSQKSALLFHFCFFFFLKGGNLDAASKACISNFVDNNAWQNDLKARFHYGVKKSILSFFYWSFHA